MVDSPGSRFDHPDARLAGVVIQADFLLLILGLPIALILAWAYEMTPDGLRKERDVVRDESITRETGRKIDFVIIGALVLALAYNIYFVNQGPNSDFAEAPTPKERKTALSRSPYCHWLT